MSKQLWQAILHADWEPSVGTACGGAISLFIWHILQSGESGAETVQMHMLGVALIAIGWSCVALAVYLLCKSVTSKLSSS